MSETTLIQALASAQAEMKNAPFDKENPHFKSKFASLTSIRNTALPVLTKHGIAVTQPGVQLDSGTWVIRTILSKGEERMEGDTPIIADKGNAQAFGSAMTYAKRYGLSAMVCIASDEDDDGNEATKSPPNHEYISIDQVKEINSEIDRLGADRKKFLQHFKVADISQLSAMQYLKAMNMLEERERRAAAQDAAEAAALNAAEAASEATA